MAEDESLLEMEINPALLLKDVCNALKLDLDAQAYVFRELGSFWKLILISMRLLRCP
jgi:hypothetical protein